MRIIIDYPPNYERLKKLFDVENNLLVVFAYGDKLYNPHAAKLQDHIILHEEVHSKQQGDKVEQWWNKYIDDKDFRLAQELEAYGKQWKFINNIPIVKRKNKDKFLDEIASTLSSSVYGNIISFNEARCKIKNYE